ncbi:DHA2 family efflux MFS transporter permease subunit [Methanobacterium sp.]|uniref:MFS transporter n=1 Tax=Methanobacterium sp. TaxID=2164 RepID=UPI0031596FE8
MNVLEKKWRILFAIAIGTIMVPINASIVNVSLPTITAFFSTTIASSEWVITAYLINLLGFVLLFGRLGDFYGHERVYMAGLISFLATSILCSLSPSITYLIIFRSLQGIAAALMISVSLGIVKSAFPHSQTGKALGIYAVAISAGLAIGPAIGGLIQTFFGWQTIFLVNIPMGITSFLLCYKVLTRDETKPVKLDVPGAILQYFCLFSVVYLLNDIQTSKLDNLTIIMAVVAVTTLMLFIWNEKRADDPLLDLEIFKNKTFSAFNLSLYFNYICMYMILFIMPFYLQKVLLCNPALTGVVLTVNPVVMMILAPVSGTLADRLGSRPLAIMGALISALAFYSMTSLTMFSNVFDVVWRLALLGIGAAIFQAPNNRAIMTVIPDKKKGLASSILVTMRNLGMVFGVSIAGILLYTTISPDALQQNQLYDLAAYNFTSGMHLIMMLGAFLSIIILILSPVGIYRKKITETKEIIQESDIIPAPQDILEESSEIINELELVKHSKELLEDSELLRYSKEIIEDPSILKRPKDILKEKIEELNLEISKKNGK